MPGTKSRRGVAERKGKTGGHDACAPPGLQQTKASQEQSSVQPMAKKTFEYPPAHGEVLVIMRYKESMDRRIRNCIIRMKGRIRQPGTEGCVLGVTSKVNVLESTPCSDWCTRDDWCLAIFMFPSMEKAQRWYNSEPELKQHDFLPPSDGVQLFTTTLRYLPQQGKLTFHWLELYNVRSKSFLQREFVDKMAEFLDDRQVNHGVIFVQDPSAPDQINRLKNSWLGHNQDVYCVVNVFGSEEEFFSLYHDDMYAHLRGKRGEVCDAVSLVFTIDPNVTG